MENLTAFSAAISNESRTPDPWARRPYISSLGTMQMAPDVPFLMLPLFSGTVCGQGGRPVDSLPGFIEIFFVVEYVNILWTFLLGTHIHTHVSIHILGTRHTHMLNKLSLLIVSSEHI